THLSCLPSFRKLVAHSLLVELLDLLLIAQIVSLAVYLQNRLLLVRSRPSSPYLFLSCFLPVFSSPLSPVNEIPTFWLPALGLFGLWVMIRTCISFWQHALIPPCCSQCCGHASRYWKCVQISCAVRQRRLRPSSRRRRASNCPMKPSRQ